MRLHLSTVLAAVVAVVVTGCGDSDRGTGIIVTGDGRMLSNSAENTRELACEHIDASLDRDLGAHWRSHTTIAQVPVLGDERSGVDDSDSYRWERADVAVELIGDGQAGLPLAPEDVREGVFDYLRSRVDRPRTNLRVAVAVLTDPARFAAYQHPVRAGSGGAETPAPGAPAPEAPRPPVPAASGASVYVIQQGDTWAELSTAFYGSSDHWRLLADANNWGGGGPRPGAVLTVPPLPSKEPVQPHAPSTTTGAPVPAPAEAAPATGATTSASVPPAAPTPATTASPAAPPTAATSAPQLEGGH